MHNLIVNETQALDSVDRNEQQGISQPVAPLAATIGSPTALHNVTNMQEAVEYYARRGWVAVDPPEF